MYERFLRLKTGTIDFAETVSIYSFVLNPFCRDKSLNLFSLLTIHSIEVDFNLVFLCSMATNRSENPGRSKFLLQTRNLSASGYFYFKTYI